MDLFCSQTETMDWTTFDALTWHRRLGHQNIKEKIHHSIELEGLVGKNSTPIFYILISLWPRKRSQELFQHIIWAMAKRIGRFSNQFGKYAWHFLAESGMGGQFWFRATMNGVNCRNETFKKRLGTNPHASEKVYGSKKDVSKFRPLGCRVYMHLNKERYKKEDKPQRELKQSISDSRLISIQAGTSSTQSEHPKDNAF